MRKEYEKSGLPDYENPDLVQEKKNEKEFVEKLEAREKATGRKLDIGVITHHNQKKKGEVSRTINGVKNQRLERMPLRIAYQKNKIDMGKLPIWYLQAIGSMTVEERDEFVKRNKKDLTINELIANDMLDGVLAKDPDITKMFWDLQKTLMGKKTVINEIHQTVKPNSVMNDILEGIEQNVMEAEKVPPSKVKKKPKVIDAEEIK